MNQAEHSPEGWRASLRRIAGSLLGLAQNRVELFAVELQEEKLRAINLVLWFWFALVLATAGLLVGLGALALCLWEAAGYAGLVALSLGALLAAAGVLWAIRRHIQTGPPPFAETAAEFKRDRECLLGKN